MMSLVRILGFNTARFSKLVLALFTVIASQLSYAGVWGEGNWGTMKWGVESGVSATASEIQVTETYIGLLDRAPDRNGLAYWVSQLNRAVAAGQEATFAMKKLTNDIALSPEWTAGLGTNNVTAQVGANTVVQGLYQNLFERAQTQADLDYWTPQLTGGSTTASEMALNLITAAKNNTERPTDGNVLGFKREAGSYYVQNVPQANYTVSTARNAVKDVNDAGSLADSKTATDIVKNGRLMLTSSSRPLQPANSERSSVSNAANDADAPATMADSRSATDTIEASLADSTAATDTVEASGMKAMSSTAGAGDDATPAARSPAAPIPSLPLGALLLLIGSLVLVGLRRLRV